MAEEGPGAGDAAAAVHGRVTGLIVPPPEIRAVVDKTAQFVARNGRSFERKIAGEVISAKFSFLRASDPYNAYYEHKVAEFEAQTAEPVAPAPAKDTEEGASQGDTKDAASVEKAAEPDDTTTTTAIEEGVVAKKPVEAVVSKSLKNLKDKNTNLDAPPADEQFKQKHPTLTPLDQEIMYMTAQYTAVSGKPFLSGLATREQRNPQFDFLKPTHPLFAYFTFLVESYAKILTAKAHHAKNKTGLNVSNPLMDALEAGVNRMHVLDRCVHKHEWMRREEEAQRREAMETDVDKIAYLQIDWHDFVVVETITFDVDDATGAGDPLPYLENDPASTSSHQADALNQDDMDMDVEDEERPAELKVVEDYVPRGAATTAPSVHITSVDGQTIHSEQANEHMRILLQAPKYREEKARHLQKVQDTPFAPGSAIADNFKRFATKRSDIFTSSADDEARLVHATQHPAPPPPPQDDDDGQHQYLPVQTQARGNNPPPVAYHIPPSQKPPPPRLPPPAGFAPPPPPPPPQPAPAQGVVAQAPPRAHPLLPPHLGVPMPVGMAGMGMPLVSGMVIPLPTAVPPPPPSQPAPTADGSTSETQPPAKRQRVDGVILLPEDEWAAQRPGPVRLCVTVPYEPDNSQWKLAGQTLILDVDILTLVRDVKTRVYEATGMPVAKQQIKAPVVGFLKDSLTCAHYNFDDDVVMELSARQRGGRR
ncbi:hypothetical protein H257_17171 [Aphanomyces astaci]|uniref:Splicing factor 3A subunit 1 n=1 Tax=Aphanomyces astaci TaxID=112090 RepID=W4FFU4_APHAT|nr:hypothetical protein H257_17171 [Aphanomyces astaci]ETV66387.1 hypothetical protein H257_17171 [Aphanomyces astaci]|eukprot:XP_009844162.1 hypothetical protein H257_17171 [Aphanomyces astaci]